MVAANSPHAPILVTGGHRTGTTWVGKMLTGSGEAAYISEPLNVHHRPGVLRVPVRCWYTYICAQNSSQYQAAFTEMLAFRYHLWREISSLRSRKDMLRMGRDWLIFARGRLRRLRPLLKDPFAVFSIPWFIEQLGCQVVVTVRHPAAFASSLKRLGWPFQFSDLLGQPLLLRDWLTPFSKEMQQIQPDDLIGQGSLLWKTIYHAVHIVKQRYPQMIIVHHESLSLDPEQGYESIYAALGLRYTERVKRIISSSSSADNPKELATQSIHATRLDSRANLHNWKRRLAPDDLGRIREITGEVAELYYPGLSWE